MYIFKLEKKYKKRYHCSIVEDLRMNRNENIYNTYVEILKSELVPAMGCTEPIALAYASAKAREVLEKIPSYVLVEVSGNIIKNVKSVVVPNTGGLRGIEAAVAAGIIGGDADLVLEVISKVSDVQKQEIKEFMDKVQIEVRPINSRALLDIKITLVHEEDHVVLRISNEHANIVHIEKNGKVLLTRKGQKKKQSKNLDYSLLSVEKILEFANNVEIEDVYATLKRQIDFNSAIAREGLNGDWGANIGSVLLKVYGNDVKTRAKAMAAAGSDARMSGCELPVIINSGSGNQGMTIANPILEYAKELNVSEDKLYRALSLANLLAVHFKQGIGRLSAYCGAVSAGVAAGCGIAYLHGADFEGIAHTIVNALAIESGMVCDGAKPSCAAKIASSVDAGILGYMMYVEGQEFKDGEGIVTKGVENTIKNVGRLGKDGMKETDREILKIMTKC